ncbi:hypothetical protein DY000_02018964 [Brassica cretica]|uniref:Photosystem I reaction center subunit VI n=1 Tax=Brassica cretica TaxID=69181 RepID=A0ABQ7CP77_BRACR|nr:hypothetical protein DY000_02018964 [Brassica cretica]
MSFGDWVSYAENSDGFTGFPPPRSTSLYLSCWKKLPEGLPGSVLIRSFSSFEEKLLPPYLLSIERGVPSVSLLSVCFSFLIVLLSCVAVSTGPEDANEITSIFLVDEAWNLTSHYVTILPLFDFVVKIPSTHSSTVLNSLSTSIEDLSCLVYLCVAVPKKKDRLVGLARRASSCPSSSQAPFVPPDPMIIQQLHNKDDRIVALEMQNATILAELAVVAKYGDKSVYFDLEDLGNTTGQWDLYGSDAPSPYNPLQSKFFETFAAPFTKRGLLLKFLILGGGSLLTYVSASSTGDVLPIKRGPQEKPKLGPRGKL